jgi:hypothetical protein
LWACVQSLRLRRLTSWVAGCCLAAAEPIQVCGVAGSGPWLVGPPPVLNWCYALAPSGLVRLGVLVQHLFMVRCCGHDMTFDTWCRNFA